MASNILQGITSAQQYLMCLEIISLLKSPWPVPTKCTDHKRKLTKPSHYCIATKQKSTAVDLGSIHRNTLL